MPIDENPPSESEIARWFLNVPSVPSGSFEFALVMGGTVSAGAYTAGAVDFLIEALDCFSAARRAGKAPNHHPILKFITGTSGGGVNAAIAARCMAFQYPHVTLESAVLDSDTKNPFYDTWVNTLRLDGFLDTSDVTGSLKSFLNGAPIDKGAGAIVAFEPNKASARDWVAAPLRIFLTVTSLTGVPYRTDFGDSLSETYVDHADYMRFAVHYPGQQLDGPRPDEQILPFDTAAVPQATNWKDFSIAAMATAAFPLGFPPRALSRPTSDYRYRVAPYPGDVPGKDSYRICVPDWQAMRGSDGKVPELWQFLCVDGGATNNEPIELARTALSGLLNRNPRDPATANRAVWLIDPFAGMADLGPTTPASFLDQALAISSALTQQTRYDSADLMMASDENIFSRFMLTPSRVDANGKNVIGSNAIASGGVGAFIGFACQDFMRFDYLLGRQNCQQFLRNEFLLATDNPLFSNWTPEQRVSFANPASAGMLPIIPLIGDAATDQKLAEWPASALDPESYREAIETRFSAMLQLELSGNPLKSALGWAEAGITKQRVADYVINAMQGYLRSAGL